MTESRPVDINALSFPRTFPPLVIQHLIEATTPGNLLVPLPFLRRLNVQTPPLPADPKNHLNSPPKPSVVYLTSHPYLLARHSTGQGVPQIEHPCGDHYSRVGHVYASARLPFPARMSQKSGKVWAVGVADWLWGVLKERSCRRGLRNRCCVGRNVARCLTSCLRDLSENRSRYPRMRRDIAS